MGEHSRPSRSRRRAPSATAGFSAATHHASPGSHHRGAGDRNQLIQLIKDSASFHHHGAGADLRGQLRAVLLFHPLRIVPGLDTALLDPVRRHRMAGSPRRKLRISGAAKPCLRAFSGPGRRPARRQQVFRPARGAFAHRPIRDGRRDGLHPGAERLRQDDAAAMHKLARDARQRGDIPARRAHRRQGDRGRRVPMNDRDLAPFAPGSAWCSSTQSLAAYDGPGHVIESRSMCCGGRAKR